MIKPINHDVISLQQVSQPAQQPDVSIARDLLDTLAAHRQECVGMAANMIGIAKRIIVVNIGPTNIAMLNPKIIAKQQPYKTSEGCLSLEGTRPTNRFQKITVKFFDLQWQKQTLRLEGFPAQIVQHEIDHCDGILI
ncbi:peptide deformylase [Limosilactobacillus caecicola]|uniref:peptide deformylase n=1 Tax=Limosilactobacillus caecicola TaxID=2941332 RepID=UPI00203D5380|nr:peptide deformylase [Limosilactobacillus caecicola]